MYNQPNNQNQSSQDWNMQPMNTQQPSSSPNYYSNQMNNQMNTQQQYNQNNNYSQNQQQNYNQNQTNEAPGEGDIEAKFPILSQPSSQPITTNEGYNPNDFINKSPTLIQYEGTQEEALVEASSDGIGICSAIQRGEDKCNVFFTIGLVVGIILLLIGLISGDFILLIVGGVMTGVFWLSTIIETSCSPTSKYLNNIKPKEEVYQHMNQMYTVAPVLWYSIQNYHYETRTEHRDGKRHTRRVRVNTHFAKGNFIYNQFQDMSTKQPNLAQYKLTKLKFMVSKSFADNFTSNEYNRQKEWFYRSNTCDRYQDYREGVELPGMINRVLSEAEPGQRHACMNSGWFWLVTLFGCSYCYRTWLGSKSGRCDYTYRKNVKTVPIVIQQPVIMQQQQMY